MQATEWILARSTNPGVSDPKHFNRHAIVVAGQGRGFNVRGEALRAGERA